MEALRRAALASLALVLAAASFVAGAGILAGTWWIALTSPSRHPTEGLFVLFIFAGAMVVTYFAGPWAFILPAVIVWALVFPIILTGKARPI